MLPVTSGQVGMLGWAVVVTGQCVASYQWPGWYAALGCGSDWSVCSQLPVARLVC